MQIPGKGKKIMVFQQVSKLTCLCLICAQNLQQYMGFYGNIW
jgi:hypothetical protein